MANEKLKYEVFDPKGDIAAKFDFYIKIVIGILIVAVITMMFMVGALIVDAFHFNSATYREYSEKISTLNTLKDGNKELLEQNKQNQQIIIDQQKQIQEFLKK